MNIGDKVVLKPEWMDKGDEHADFRITELLGTERLRMVDNNSTLFIKPTFVINTNMTEAL